MKQNQLWHKVSEKEKEEIKKQAKKLLDNFASKLKKIKTKEQLYESGEGMREQGEPWNSDEEFRNLMFDNAPFTEDDFLVAEKGGWK